MYLLPEKLLVEIVNYLTKRPYVESAPIISKLQHIEKDQESKDAVEKRKEPKNRV